MVKNMVKYGENDCLKDFLFLVMSLLIAPVVKNSLIQARTYFFFLKKDLK